MNRPRNQPSLWQQLLFLPFNKQSAKTFQPTNQGSLLPQGNSTPIAEPNVFERIEEYKAILDHHAQLSTRRQHTSDV